jgi:hypothetical protein
MFFWKKNHMHPSRSKECESNNLLIIHSVKIIPTACKKFDDFLMYYPSKNTCINKNMHYSVPYHRVVAYKYTVLIAHWS